MCMWIAVAIALVALVGGVALIIWAMRNKGKGNNIAKISGYIIAIIGILIILITFFMCSSMGGMMKNGHPINHMMHENMQ